MAGRNVMRASFPKIFRSDLKTPNHKNAANFTDQILGAFEVFVVRF